MSKRNFEGLTAKGTKHEKTRDSFNPEWLKLKVTTDTPDLKGVQYVELRSIYEYSYENGLKCKICAAGSRFKTVDLHKAYALRKEQKVRRQKF